MKLIIDIGNTNIVAGVFNDENGSSVHSSFRISTPSFTTTDELALKFKQLLNHHSSGLAKQEITAAAFTSVVPSINHNITKLISLYFNHDIIEINHSMFKNFSINYSDILDLGIDRLVNLKAASKLTQKPAVVIDYGTAVTVDVLNTSNAYEGGLIIPGIGVSLEALVASTSKLPNIELKQPQQLLGNSTKSGMQNGIYHLYAMGIDAIINAIKEKHFINKNFSIISTGGFARFISSSSKWQQEVNPYLTLIGSKIVLEEYLNGK